MSQRAFFQEKLAELAGLRYTTRDSLNTGWRNASFRGYAT